MTEIVLNTPRGCISSFNTDLSRWAAGRAREPTATLQQGLTLGSGGVVWSTGGGGSADAWGQAAAEVTATARAGKVLREEGRTRWSFHREG